MDRDSTGETPSALCPPQEAGFTLNLLTPQIWHYACSYIYLDEGKGTGGFLMEIAVFTPYHRTPVRERGDECSELPAREVPQSHGRKSVVRGLPQS